MTDEAVNVDPARCPGVICAELCDARSCTCPVCACPLCLSRQATARRGHLEPARRRRADLELARELSLFDETPGDHHDPAL